MAKTVKRGRGHKIGPAKEWIAERETRIRLHRQRIIEEIRQIRKAGLDPANDTIERIQKAGVKIDEFSLRWDKLSIFNPYGTG